MPALRRQAAEASVERRVAETKLAPEDAAAKLLRERRPDQLVPMDRGALLDALAETEASPTQRTALAARRLETLRTAFKGRGPSVRVVETALDERPQAAEAAVELKLLEPDAPRRSQFLQMLEKLGGTGPGQQD